MYGEGAYVNSIILARDILHWPNNTIHRAMVPMIILRQHCISPLSLPEWPNTTHLRRQPENPQSSTIVLGKLVSIRLAQQSLDGELAPLDPQARGIADSLECHHAAVSAGDEAGGVGGAVEWASCFFQFSKRG